MKLGKLLLSIVIVSLIVSMAIPMAAAPKPDKPPGKPQEPPADPAICYRRADALYVMNADGSNQVRIWDNAGNPCWAPDGSAIAFGFENVLYRVDVTVVNGVPQGSNPMVLTDKIKSSPPKWSPAGDVIAFLNTLNGEYRLIQTVPATGGTVETIYTAPEGYNVFSMTWRSDSSKMAIELFTYPPDQFEIIMLDLSDHSTTTVYGPTTTYVSHLDWARTSDTLVINLRDGIYTLDLTQPNPTPQVLIAGNNNWPIWSPDDSQILYRGMYKNHYKLSIYTLSTEESEILCTGMAPDWSRE